MSHPMKKSTRSRINLTTSTPIQYSQSRAQNNQPSWTAADAAKASKNGAFLTPWPPKEPYYTPAVDLFGQGQSQTGLKAGAKLLKPASPTVIRNIDA
ncbi:uncharacterized protein F4812DRAFT_455431 [Daldinia caldariorum]|uniref:uncharacterized protein n=1 Tax=Daldinia caldariorum TaxID=326644 RepID=UPI002008E950|nr:uncharacterized protein F4812DRAFT_455431 [Daldinia caldariorum]KAI1471318.1 hypothetical protein F4812DRAFT_455431 [Daldinia caldariorum]